MCRILCIASNERLSISKHLERFAKGCEESKEYQGHGWGVTYLQDGSLETYRNIKPIWEDFDRVFPSSTLFLVHARSAFRDEGIVVENNMPFLDSQNCFIFNGELQGVNVTGRSRC